MEDKKEDDTLDMKIAEAIHQCLKSQKETETYVRTIAAILNGATAVIAGINRKMNYNNLEFLTYKVTQAWLESFYVKNNSSTNRNNDRIRTKKTRENPRVD